MSNKKSHKSSKRKAEDEAIDNSNEMGWDLEKPPKHTKHKKTKTETTRKKRDSSSSSSSSSDSASSSSSSSSDSSSASSSSGKGSTKGKQQQEEAQKKSFDRVEKDKSSAMQESAQHKSKWDSPDERRRPRSRSRSRQRDTRRHEQQQQQHNRDRDRDRVRERERNDDYYNNDRRRDYGGRCRGRYENRERDETRYRRSRSRPDRDNGGGGEGAGGRGRYNERRRSRSRSPRRERDQRAKRNDYSPRPPQQRRARRNSRDDDKQYEWGKKGDQTQQKSNNSPQEKDKPNFGLSGALTEDANKVNGVVVKYAEPPEARKPKRRWRLYPFKGETALPILHIHRQSCFLVGRDRKVVDLAVDHPSCSKQHAALQYRLVPFERDDGTQGKRVRLYLIDLESANGTFINNKKIDARKYYELIEKDVIKFGFSTREYVLLHENSKEDQEDDDVLVKQEIKEEADPA